MTEQANALDEAQPPPTEQQAVGGGSGDTTAEDPDESSTRERSTIKFPYFDLADAELVARTLKDRRGGSAEVHELAADLGQKVSGSFRLRLSACRMFGLIEIDKSHVALTSLGDTIGGPDALSARVEAFLRVPLYERLYARYKATTLPPDPGLESAMRLLGVVTNQVARARQVFKRSAEQAGFFTSGRDRLVKPPLGGSDTGRVNADDTGDADTLDDRSKTRVGGSPVSDPMLAGLLRRMLPNEGEAFSASQRRLFFTALAVNLDVIYGPPTDGDLDPTMLAGLYRDDPTN